MINNNHKNLYVVFANYVPKQFNSIHHIFRVCLCECVEMLLQKMFVTFIHRRSPHRRRHLRFLHVPLYVFICGAYREHSEYEYQQRAEYTPLKERRHHRRPHGV